jgi:aminoglycoside phosphotransferase (APT) family kinase protein
MERCEGVTAEDADLTPESIERVARAAGRYAGEYHAVGEFRRFGRLRIDCDLKGSRVGATVNDRTLAVADEGHTSWRSWIEKLYRNWIDDFDSRFVDLRPELEAFIESRMETLDRSFDAVLGHIDYKPWNFLVRPERGETTAVLDWGHATAIAPYYDLILSEEHLSRWAPLDSPRRRRVRTALEEGYSETNELERDADFDERQELYLAVSRLQPLVWFSEWMADESSAEQQEAADRHRQFVYDLQK